MKGRVKWWSNDRGYGFIEYNESESIFAHIEKEDKYSYQFEENQEIVFFLVEKENGVFLKLLQTLEN